MTRGDWQSPQEVRVFYPTPWVRTDDALLRVAFRSADVLLFLFRAFVHACTHARTHARTQARAVSTVWCSY